MTKRLRSYLIPLSLPAFLAACNKEAPIDPGTMSQQAADRSAEVIRTGAKAMEGNRGATAAVSDTGEGIGQMVRVFSSPSSSSSSGGVERVGPPPTASGSPGSPGARIARASWGKLTLQSLESVAALLARQTDEAPAPAVKGDVILARADAADDLSADLDRSADSLRKLIRDRLLADMNIESKTDAEVIYRLKPEVTCRDLDRPEVLDGSCVEDLTKLEVRIRLTRSGDDGAELGVLLGKERVHLLSGFVLPNRLALAVYLGRLKEAITVVSKAFDEQPPELPGVLKGAVETSITKEGPRKVTAAFAILEDIEISSPDPKFSLRTAATNPAWAVTADGGDGVSGSITAKVNVAKTEIVVPWEPGSLPTNADATIVLGGLTGETTFTEAQKTVVLKKLGLGAGPSYLQVRGDRIVEANLNPESGRSFDLSIGFDAAGRPRIAFTPNVDFGVMCALGRVASDFDEVPPSFLLDETYRLGIAPAGGSGPVLEPYESASPDVDGGIRVVSGVFSLSSSKVAEPVSASAGQCLVGAEPAPDAHPLLGSVKVVPCP